MFPPNTRFFTAVSDHRSFDIIVFVWGMMANTSLNLVLFHTTGTNETRQFGTEEASAEDMGGLQAEECQRRAGQRRTLHRGVV